MFDNPFDFLPFILAIVALGVAVKAMNQITELRSRLNRMEIAALARSAPPPLPPMFEQGTAPTAPGIAAEPPPIAPDAEWAAPGFSKPAETAAETVADMAGSPPAAPPPPLPQPDPGFRGNHRHPLGGVDRRPDAGARRHLHGALFDRSQPDQRRSARLPRRPVRAALLAAGEWTRRKESISAIAALPIANIPAILTAAGTAVAFATVYVAYAVYGFLVPATAFILLGIVAMGTLAAALLHGPALAGLGIAAAFVTPLLVSSGKPDFWALYIYLAIVTAAAFGLARVRLWRWLAVTTIAFAMLWTFPCLQCGPSMIGAACVPCDRRLHPRRPARGVRLHVRAISRGRRDRTDFVRLARGLSARRNPDRAEQFSCRRRHGHVRPAGGRQPDRGLAHRCGGRRGWCCRRPGVRRVRRMGDPRQSRHAGAARRPDRGHRSISHGRIGVAASDLRRDLRHRFRRRRIPGAGPIGKPDHSRGLVGGGRVHAAGAVDRALCPHRASRPLDPVRHSRRHPGRSLCGSDRDPEQARGPPGNAGLDRAVCDRRARSASRWL